MVCTWNSDLFGYTHPYFVRKSLQIGVSPFRLTAMLISLLVVLPAIAQRIVGDMSLPIYSVAIRALGPEECELTINTGLSTPAGIGINMRDSLLHLYNI